MLATALAAVAVACGPSGAETLAQTAHVRVYEQRGTAYGCSPGRRIALGRADRVQHVYVGGRFAAVRRKRGLRRVAAGLRPAPGRPRGVKARVRRFTAIRFNARGFATYLAYRIPTGALGLFDTTGEEFDARGADPTVLGQQGQVLMTRVGSAYQFQDRVDEESPDRARRHAAQAGRGADQRPQRQPTRGAAPGRLAGRSRRGAGRVRVLVRLLRDQMAPARRRPRTRRRSTPTRPAAASRSTSRSSISRPVSRGARATTRAATC